MNRWDGKKVKDWSTLIGHRCLVIEDTFLDTGCEVNVLEVSPSKLRIKFEYPLGAKVWETASEYLLIEDLGSF